MTNREWESKMDRCRKAFSEYYSLLQQIEAEYEERFGDNPSGLNDDGWIDAFHYGRGPYLSVKDVEKSNELYK